MLPRCSVRIQNTFGGGTKFKNTWPVFFFLYINSPKDSFNVDDIGR